MKRWFFISFLMIFLALVSIVQIFEEELSKEVSELVSENLKDSLPFDIEFEKLVFKPLNLTIAVRNINLKNVDPSLQEVIPIESIKAKIDPYELFFGRVLIEKISIDGLHIIAENESSSDEPFELQDLNINEIFETLNQIPVQTIEINRLSFKITDTQLKSEIKGIIDHSEISHFYRLLSIKVSNLTWDIFYDNKIDFQGKLDLEAKLSPNILKIIQLNANSAESFVNVKGVLIDYKKTLDAPNFELQTNGRIKADDLARLELYRLIPKLPDLKGEVEFQAELATQNLYASQNGNFKIKGTNLAIDENRVGNLFIEGNLGDRKVILSQINISQEAGTAQLNNTHLLFEDNAWKFQTEAQIDELNLQELFISLDLNKIPVWTTVRGTVPCEGQMYPRFSMNCSGKARIENLVVRSKKNDPKSEIVALDQGDATGSFTVDEEKVTYKADVELANGKGTSYGVINYDTGFIIHFDGGDVDFSKVKNVVDLNIKGIAKIFGSTSGNADTATTEIHVDSKGAIVDGFKLGDAKMIVSYSQDYLYFDRLQSTLGESTYEGEFFIFLPDDQIEGRAQSSYLRLEDLGDFLNHKFNIEVPITGTGSAKVQFRGPLEFNRMSYELNSSFLKGSLYQESFQRVNLNLISEKGQISSKDFEVTKGDQKIPVELSINPEWEIDLRTVVNNFNSRNSDYFYSYLPNTRGTLNFTAKISNTIEEPTLTVKGSLNNFFLSEAKLKDSFYELNISNDAFTGKFDMFEKEISLQTQIPFNRQRNNISILSGEFNKFNFAPILGSLFENEVAYEYFTTLTGQFDFKGPVDPVWKPTGKAKIDRFLVVRNELTLRNLKPIEVQANNGQFEVNNFRLKGPNSHVTIETDSFRFDNIVTRIDSKLDLRFIQIFLPFLDDAAGQGELRLSTKGPFWRPLFLGEGRLSNGFAKLRDFPHPLESLQSDFLFSQNKITIPSIKGSLGGGALTGTGQISIETLTNIPVLVDLSIKNSQLEIPKDVKTRGDLDLQLKGQWFPYLLSGTYSVKNSKVTLDFTDGSKSSQARRSRFLPQVEKQVSNTPIEIDINIDMKNGEIENDVIRSNFAGSLNVTGNPSEPSMSGRLSVEKGGKIYFSDKEFIISSSTVDFNSGTDINPSIFLTADTRIGDYDINILVQGKASDPLFRLTSSPSLSENDIISLLAIGITSQKIEEDVGSDEQAKNTTFQLGSQIVNQNPLSRQLKQSLGLEAQVKSTFDETKNSTVQSIELNYPINPKLNAGYSRLLGEDITEEYRLQYQINENVSAIGFLERKENQEIESISNDPSGDDSTYGVDLEYRVEFK